MQVTRRSCLSGITRTFEIDVTQEQLDAHATGTLAQDAFPHLNRDDREFLISGITMKEWAERFGP